jgi:NADPH:quinone reductase-like Zn-dependent oxidoreductase
MKAIAIDAYKTPGSLHELPEPPLGDDAIRVAVSFAGVNPVDWKIREGAMGRDRKPPLVLGQDFAGTVEAVSGRPHAERGTRVFGCARASGAYAEQTVVPNHARDSPYAPIPEGLSDELAAALPTPGLTALGSLALLEAASGTRLLIVGAAGAVGSIAVQAARHRGARVSAVVRPGQAEQVRAYGVGVVETGDGVLDAVRAAGHEAFDAVLDLVSDRDALKQIAPLLRRGGKLVSTIHVADEEWFEAHDIAATNIVMSETPQSSPEGLAELANLVSGGIVKVALTGERPLAEAPALLDEMQAGSRSGKFVLRVRG